MMKQTKLHDSQGVALLAALFVLMVMSILGIGMLANVDEDLKIAKNHENSERALKIAEAGIQIARSSFFDPAEEELTVEDRELHSVNGFIHGGYFMAQLTSGFTGREKWTQWRYDLGLSGNNTESEITAPLRRVWATSDEGVNGSWSGDTYYVENLYGVVATGIYFPIEYDDGDGKTKVRARHEYSGRNSIWGDDKEVTDTGSSVGYAVGMSPLATYSVYSGDTRTEQVLYYTYAGQSTAISLSDADTSSTVRLRAADAMSNMAQKWEFDTGLHGVGTAPALFDPDPDTRGDEILYFLVISMGAHDYTSLPPGASGTKDLNEANASTNPRNFYSYPSEATDSPEQIYLFAVVDHGNSYTVKWNRPFPDPDIAEWTDYPMEHATGTDGQSAPFIGRPSDINFYPPEDDLLFDYRDGPGTDNAHYGYDQQWNQMRGNVYGADPQACSPPVVNVLYEDSSGNLTTKYEDATAASKADPIIDIYLMYAHHTRVTYYRPSGDDDARHQFGNRVIDINGENNAGWGDEGYRKPNAVQTRVIALRDRLATSGGSWDWNDAKSRFPEFKWSYRVPGHDPNPTDDIPPTGYGEYSWDTWFIQQIAPMIMTQDRNSEDSDADDRRGDDDDEGASFSAIASSNIYTILYPYYKSVGFPTGGGNNNDGSTNSQGPTIAEGAPSDFSGQGWADARAMVMAVRDSWDDYVTGTRTNIYGASNANPELSNPAEPYWYYSDYDNTNGPHADDHKYQDGDPTIMYNASYTDAAGVTQNAPYPSGVRAGFPRPYTWSESLWDENVRDAATDATTDPPDWSMYKQGWINADFTSTSADTSTDIDIEGETSAICKTCLQDQGIMVLTFNHDLESGSTDREDLRLHGINARTGLHVWDYHMAATLAGDNANNTPAIANNKVFVAYMMYGAETDDDNRQALITVLDANDGSPIYEEGVIDDDADAVILPPTIANGMSYVATYDFSDTRGASSTGDDYIRLFALSPMLRLVSTGIYPMEYQDSSTITDQEDMMKDEDVDYSVDRIKSARRTLQVWISGDSSRWEEVKEDLVP